MTTREMFDIEGWKYNDKTPNLQFDLYKKSGLDIIIKLDNRIYKLSPTRIGKKIYCIIELLHKYKLPIDIPKVIRVIELVYRENLIMNVSNNSQ